MGAVNGNDPSITKYDTGDFGTIDENPEKYMNLIPGKTGTMLVYNYANGTLNLWLEPVPGK